jgi:hypothetical protein
LLDEFLKLLDPNANGLAQATRLPAYRSAAILNGDRGVTEETALGLAGYIDEEVKPLKGTAVALATHARSQSPSSCGVASKAWTECCVVRLRERAARVRWG